MVGIRLVDFLGFSYSVWRGNNGPIFKADQEYARLAHFIYATTMSLMQSLAVQKTAPEYCVAAGGKLFYELTGTCIAVMKLDCTLSSTSHGIRYVHCIHA